MVSVGLGRRAFVEGLVAVPFGGMALSARTSTSHVVKVAAGSGRANEIITLPGGDRIHLAPWAILGLLLLSALVLWIASRAVRRMEISYGAET